MTLPHQGSLWQLPSFSRFLTARVIGILSNQMLMLAIAWHVYDLTSSAWDLGLVGLFQFIPALIMTLPAGHLADRVHRGHIFAVCLLVQMGVAASLLMATYDQFATREMMFALSVVLGMTRAFQMPAQQAITPLLVPTELLQSAVAVSSGGMQAAIIAGPALGGVLYAISPLWVYGACVSLTFLAALQTWRVTIPHHIKADAASWSSVLAGVVFVWQRKLLLGAMSLDLFAVLLGGATALLPIYARDILHIGPQGLGLLRSAPAVGALLMSLWLARHPMERHVGQRLLWAIGVFGLATLVFGVSRNVVISWLALVITGAADNISVVIRLTLMQLETPDEMRGRVAAVNTVFIGASNQLGEFESGATAALLGAVGSVILGGAGTIAVAWLWMKWFPTLAQRDRMTKDEATDR